MGVVDTGPGEAAGAAAVRSRLSVDHIAQSPSAGNAGEKVDISRALRIGGLHDAGVDLADLVLSHQRHCRRTQQLRAIEAALIEQHLQEGEIIAAGGIKPAAAAPELAPLWI